MSTSRTVGELFQQIEEKKLERAKAMHQLMLKELIYKLSKVGQDKVCLIEGSVDGNPNGVHSYRGYYTDLSVDPSGDRDVMVDEVLGMLKGALGGTYEGWKGGYYTMGSDTLVWVAQEGTSNDDAIVDVVEEPYAVVLVTAKTRE